MEIYYLFEQNPFFTTIFLFVVGLSLFEIVLSVTGLSLNALFDSILPDFSIDIDSGSPSTFAELFSWINKGRVPMIMLFLISLYSFSIVGLSLRYSFSAINVYIASFLAFIATLFIVRYVSILLSKIIPRDETTAISQDMFLKKIAIITLGTATKDKAAEAKLKDMFGETHYIMVKPYIDNESFKKGDTVFVVSRDSKNKSLFYVLKDQN